MSNKPIKFILNQNEEKRKKQSKKWTQYRNNELVKLTWNNAHLQHGYMENYVKHKLITNNMFKDRTNFVQTVKHLKIDLFIDYATGYSTKGLFYDVANILTNSPPSISDNLQIDANHVICRNICFFKAYVLYIPAGCVMNTSFTCIKDYGFHFSPNNTVIQHPEWVIGEQDILLNPDQTANIKIECPLARNLRSNDSIYLYICSIHKNLKWEIWWPRTNVFVDFSYTSSL